MGILFLSGCGFASPDAGHEAVLVMKPWLFGHGGVYPEAVKTGRSVIAITTHVVDVSVVPEQYKVHFDDLMSLDGVPLDFDAIIRLQVMDSVRLVRDFGPKWYENNLEKELANRVRQSVRKHGMNETAISTVAIEQIDQEVSAMMEKYIQEAKIPIKLIQVTVGKANPPDAIKNQRIATAAEQQRQLTEQQRKLAEDQRRFAEESRAKADQAYQAQMQLSLAQFLQLEQLKTWREVCKQGNCSFVVGVDAIPMASVR
jgi:regulator of protease activity HflC (stomatin/prohibitin superfamily)